MDAINFLTIPIIVTGFVGLVLAWLLLSYIPLRLWIAAWASGVRISLGALVGMRLRKVPPHVVVEPQINATKAGLHLLLLSDGHGAALFGLRLRNPLVGFGLVGL